MCPIHTHTHTARGHRKRGWGGGRKVRQTQRAREVTGTTTDPRVVPMETSVAAHNEGERVMKERERERAGEE